MGPRLGFLVACALIACSGCKSPPTRARVEGPSVDAASREEVETSEADLTDEPSIPLHEVIALAQARSPQASFLHAELWQVDGRATCLVCFWSQEKCLYFTIDAETGDVLSEGSDALHDAQTEAEMRSIVDSGNDPIAPERAIARAVAAVPGSWARILDLEEKTGALEYSVEVVAGDVVKEVRLLAANGEVLSVLDAEDRIEMLDEVD